jgi:hypothetical protein
MTALILSSACRTERVDPQSCVAGIVQDKWVERRTPAPGAADTARAALSVTLTTPPDSIDRPPSGAMMSLLIAGPIGAERPDTVRLLTAEVPGGPLWSGNELRAGTYSASLTTDGFDAGAREFALAPGERLELQAAMARTCASQDK